MSANIPLIGAIATIQAVDVVPASGFEWVRLGVQVFLGVIGFLHHRRIANQNNQNNQNS